jgi:hypothetical protein
LFEKSDWVLHGVCVFFFRHHVRHQGGLCQ